MLFLLYNSLSCKVKRRSLQRANIIAFVIRKANHIFPTGGERTTMPADYKVNDVLAGRRFRPTINQSGEHRAIDRSRMTMSRYGIFLILLLPTLADIADRRL